MKKNCLTLHTVDKEKDTIKLETGSHAITITTADLSSNNKVTIPIE